MPDPLPKLEAAIAASDLTPSEGEALLKAARSVEDASKVPPALTVWLAAREFCGRDVRVQAAEEQRDYARKESKRAKEETSVIRQRLQVEQSRSLADHVRARMRGRLSE